MLGTIWYFNLIFHLDLMPMVNVTFIIVYVDNHTLVLWKFQALYSAKQRQELVESNQKVILNLSG